MSLASGRTHIDDDGDKLDSRSRDDHVCAIGEGRKWWRGWQGIMARTLPIWLLAAAIRTWEYQRLLRQFGTRFQWHKALIFQAEENQGKLCGKASRLRVADVGDGFACRLWDAVLLPCFRRALPHPRETNLDKFLLKIMKNMRHVPFSIIDRYYLHENKRKEKEGNCWCDKKYQSTKVNHK